MTFLMPVVIIGNREVVLSLEVDDTTRDVLSYTVLNTTAKPVAVSIEVGTGTDSFKVGQSFPTGTRSGNIPKTRRWNLDDETLAVSYNISTSATAASLSNAAK